MVLLCQYSYNSLKFSLILLFLDDVVNRVLVPAKHRYCTIAEDNNMYSFLLDKVDTF